MAALPPLADTSDMIGLHRVFRDAMAAGPSLVGTVDSAHSARIDLVGSYYANVLSLLAGHHSGEDALLTPRLTQRLPEQADLIAGIAAQHASVHDYMAAVDTAVARWRATPSVDSRDRLVDDLAALDAALTPHLDDEEREILPLAATCITAPEWGELPSHGMRSFTGDKLWLITGLIQEQMRSDQIVAMEAHMPPPVLASWVDFGRAQYAAFVAELRTPS